MSDSPLPRWPARRRGVFAALACLAGSAAMQPAAQAATATHNVSQLVLGTHEPLPAGTARTFPCGNACRGGPERDVTRPGWVQPMRASSRQPNSRAKSTDTRACTAPCSSKKRWRPRAVKTPSCQMFGWM